MVFESSMRDSILVGLREVMLSRTPLDALPADVWKRTAALNTWGTNAIEGNTLSRQDVEKLLLQGESVAGRPVSDVLETIQHESAFRRLLDRRAFPITLVTVLELHEAVFRGVKADAGQWRRVNVRITGSRLVPPRMERVVGLMDDWRKEYAHRETGGEQDFDLAAWMHSAFESIHPFSDGNGRVGRLLLNLHFLKHNWPPIHIVPPDRTRYIRSLESAHGGDLVGLTGLLRELMGRSLIDLLDQIGTKEDELRELRAFGAKGPFSAKYLALRASQGELAAVKVSGNWQTSSRAMRLYRASVARRISVSAE